MKATLVFKNGIVATMDEKENYFNAIAIKNGNIIALGTEKEIDQYIGEETKVIDLDGKVVLPGLIDAHQHIFNTGLNLQEVNCKVSSIEKMVEKCKKRSKEINDDEQWVIGWGYDESLLAEGRKPLAEDFSEINNPVFINHYSGHSAVVNDKALEVAGVSAETKVDYGKIEVNEEGKPTGRLVEGAADLITDCIPPYTDQQLMNALRLADDKYIKYGITSVHEAGMGMTTNSLKEFKLLQKAKKTKELKLRIYAMVLDEFYEDVKKANLISGFGNDQLKIGSIKIFTDGTLSGKTAAVSKSYNDDDTYGEKVHSIKSLKKFIHDAHCQGYQIACHAIGDDAVKDVLDAYEYALNLHPDDNSRHRIEHASVTDKALMQRMKKLNVIPVPQPVFIYFAGDIYVENLNEELAAGIIPIKSFLEEGLFPAGSSDSPVQDPSPFLGMYSAMSRKTINNNVIVSDESISLYQSLQLYTSYAAYSAFEEDIKGTLQEGKLADLTILPEGFLEYSPIQVKDTKVEMTIINGEVVYSKN